jgi:hypothetical protein
MRIVPSLILLVLATSGAAAAQPYGPPPGSYQRQCRDIRMEGQFLSAFCRGERGQGRSSINVMSCSSDIYVDPTGALACQGPGGGRPPFPPPQGPGYRPPPPGPGPGYPPGYPPDYRPPYGRYGAILFAQPGWRGRSIRVEGEVPNLASSGLNDRVRSIQLGPRSGPWLVCEDAGYRGRCVTITRSIEDTRRIGLRDSISSLRPQ